MLLLLDKDNRIKATFDNFGNLPTALNLTVNKRIDIDGDHPVITSSGPNDKYRLQASSEQLYSFTMEDIVLFIAE